MAESIVGIQRDDLTYKWKCQQARTHQRNTLRGVGGGESNWVGGGEDIRGERLSALTGDGVEWASERKSPAPSWLGEAREN